MRPRCVIGRPSSDLADAVARSSNPAIGAFEQLLELIEALQERLDDKHELGAYLANNELPFHLQSVKRKGVMFLFEGVRRRQDVLAIQHYGQLSLQLAKVEKLKEKPARVGFIGNEP